MKIKLLLFLSLFLFLSCRNEENDAQKIDQVINIYMHNADGVDLLNTRIKGGYTGVSGQDLNADRALQEISGFSVKKDKDTVAYIDYVAGATKLLKDSISPSEKKYQSDFYLNLSKTIDNNTVVDTDTIKIEYDWSPAVFQVSKIWYNQKLVFTKAEGQANIIKIVK